MRPHFFDLYPNIFLLIILLLPFGNSFVCPDGTRALCCLSNPFSNPKANKVYQRCKLWLEYFNKPECRDTEGHVCCETYLGNGLGKRCKKATAADSCPAAYPPPQEPNPDDLDPSGGSNSGDGHGPSPEDGFLPGDSGSSPDDDPPNPNDKPGNDGGGGDEPWWPKRPPGLWKAKKVRRRDCSGAGAGLPIMPKSSSLMSEEGNGNEHVVAAVADNTEEEHAAIAATVPQGFQDNMGGYNAFVESPGRGDIHVSFDFDLAAPGLEGADFLQQTPAEDKKDTILDS